MLGVRQPLNPGVHRIAAVRGDERDEQDLQLVERAQEERVLKFSMLLVAHELNTSVVAPHAAPATDVLTPVGVVGLSLGGVSLVTSAVTGLMALGKCPHKECEAERIPTYETLKSLSTVTVYLGAALAVGGAVALFVGQRAAHERDERLGWVVGPGGIAVYGAF
jgi:hypothetical protein